MKQSQVKTLERRARYLMNRVSNSPDELSYNKAELSALIAALEVIDEFTVLRVEILKEGLLDEIPRP